MPRKLDGTYIQTGSITTTQLSSAVTTQISAGGGPRVSSLVYPGNDTAANTVGGQTVYIIGSGFDTNNAVYINGNAVPSKSFISASNVSFTTPALSAGIYPVYFINTDTGATAIFVPGLTVSAEPAWVTSAGSLNASQDEASAWSYSLSATGDAPITYALANGSSLPTGISLAANGLISGTLSSPPGTETTYTFSVVATDAQNQDSTRQFTVTTSSGEGALFANNVLLIHADGTNNKNNHTFLDSSNNNFTITRNGNATQGSFSPFSQTGWSNYFDGDNDTLRMSGNVLSGAGNVTIECWVYPETSSIIGLFDGGPNQAGIIRNYPANTIQHQSSGSGATFSLTPNTWSHFATTFNSGVIKVYVNGVDTGNGTYTGDYSVGTNFDIGGINAGGDGDFKGYISNFRVTKSIVYSGNFTPPTTTLTKLANTTLLTCQSNRFIDNSNNAYAITRNGNTSIQVWSPFAPTTAYSTANVGGSVYLDGDGDYLTLPAGSAFAYGTGDFTIDGWFYNDGTYYFYYGDTYGLLWSQTVSGTNYFIIGTGSPANRKVDFTFGTIGGGTAVTSSNDWQINAWNHFAVVRSSGTVTVYVNGVGGTPVSCTQNFSDTSYVPTIGRYTHDPGNKFKGHISNLRVIKGSAIYSSNFTPPTAPTTNIANTSALLNFTNAGIFDQTAKNIIETVGDAKVSTVQYKYGTASMFFDGTGDYLYIANNVVNTIGSADFTIETWVYPTSFADWKGIIGYGPTNPTHLVLRLNASGNVQYWLNSPANIVSSNVSLSLNTWSHVALVRSGSGSNNVKLYVNGSLVGQSTSTYTVPQYQIVIGRTYDASDQEYFAGYLDDLRITKGYARYTSNFSAPTAAFRDK
jgi:hypothetical protein